MLQRIFVLLLWSLLILVLAHPAMTKSHMTSSDPVEHQMQLQQPAERRS